MKTVHLNTLTAGIWARDCELINFYFNDNGLKISYHRDGDNTYWIAHFNSLTAYKLISEELSRSGYLRDLPSDGVFYEILDSPWIDELGGERSRLLEGSRHFILKFHNKTIEIIAEKFEFEQLKDKPANIPY